MYRSIDKVDWFIVGKFLGGKVFIKVKKKKIVPCVLSTKSKNVVY